MFPHPNSALTLFTGTANRKLGLATTRELGYEPGKSCIVNFEDGEIMPRFGRDVRNTDAFILQPTQPPREHQWQIELMVRAARSSAGRITVVLPYFGYARQDRKTEARTPISVVQAARSLVRSGPDCIVLFEPHFVQLAGIFEALDEDLSVETVFPSPVFLDYLMKHFDSGFLKHAKIASPDAGGVKRAEVYYTRLRRLGYRGIELGFAHKSGTQSKGIRGIRLDGGNYERRNVIAFDDIITSGGTARRHATATKMRGATSYTLVVTHMVGVSIKNCEKLATSDIDRIITTDTLPIPPEIRKILGRKLTVVSVARMMALVIDHLHKGESISALHTLKGYLAV